MYRGISYEGACSVIDNMSYRELANWMIHARPPSKTSRGRRSQLFPANSRHDILRHNAKVLCIKVHGAFVGEVKEECEETLLSVLDTLLARYRLNPEDGPMDTTQEYKSFAKMFHMSTPIHTTARDVFIDCIDKFLSVIDSKVNKVRCVTTVTSVANVFEAFETVTVLDTLRLPMQEGDDDVTLDNLFNHAVSKRVHGGGLLSTEIKYTFNEAVVIHLKRGVGLDVVTNKTVKSNQAVYGMHSPNFLKDYEMSAMICHTDCHYWTIIQKAGKWYVCDDDSDIRVIDDFWNRSIQENENIPIAVIGLIYQRRLAPRGITNGGNACYFNSGLQALMHTPAFQAVFTSNDGLV